MWIDDSMLVLVRWEAWNWAVARLDRINRVGGRGFGCRIGFSEGGRVVG